MNSTTSTNRFYGAPLSACFAALTGILAKTGIQGIDSDLPTLVRAAIIIVLLTVRR
jgi:transporter family protein